MPLTRRKRSNLTPSFLSVLGGIGEGRRESWSGLGEVLGGSWGGLGGSREGLGEVMQPRTPAWIRKWRQGGPPGDRKAATEANLASFWKQNESQKATQTEFKSRNIATKLDQKINTVFGSFFYWILVDF